MVTKGFTQTYGIDYSKTFARFAMLYIVRILLSLLANLDWPLHHLGIINIFLNGDLEEVYMDGSPRFEDQFGSQAWKLKKSHYDVNQSLRAWF